jgi:hypothetical protein
MRFSWDGSDDLRAKIELPRCRQYVPGYFLAVRQLHWNEIIDDNDYDKNWLDPGTPSGGRSRPGNGNDNDNGECEDDSCSGDKGIGKG